MRNDSEVKEAEINQIDTRFEGFRLKDRSREKALLGSILEQGVRDALRCVVKPEGELILLDGFKRLRCSKKLGIKVVPVASLGSDEAEGILQFIRSSSVRGLNILEEATMVDELHRSYGMSAMEIARHVERSPAWVSVRLGLIGEMSEAVKRVIFTGRFPVRSYMYTLRHFTRVKGVRKSEVDKFVRAVSGKGLSTRAIETLAHGFFKGGEKLKEQILKGNIDWTLNQLRQGETAKRTSLSELESKTLRDLELAQGCIRRIPYRLGDSRLRGESFFETASLLVGKILKKVGFFKEALEEFYDRGREKESG